MPKLKKGQFAIVFETKKKVDLSALDKFAQEEFDKKKAKSIASQKKYPGGEDFFSAWQLDIESDPAKSSAKFIVKKPKKSAGSYEVNLGDLEEYTIEIKDGAIICTPNNNYTVKMAMELAAKIDPQAKMTVELPDDHNKLAKKRIMVEYNSQHADKLSDELLAIKEGDNPPVVMKRHAFPEHEEDISASHVTANSPGKLNDCSLFTFAHMFAQAVRRGDMDYLENSTEFSGGLKAFIDEFAAFHSEFKSAVDGKPLADQFNELKSWVNHYNSPVDTEVLFAPVLRNYTIKYLFNKFLQKATTESYVNLTKTGEQDEFKLVFDCMYGAYKDMHMKDADKPDNKTAHNAMVAWLKTASEEDKKQLLAHAFANYGDNLRGKMLPRMPMVHLANSLGVKLKVRQHEGGNEYRNLAEDENLKERDGMPVFYMHNTGVHWQAKLPKAEDGYAKEVGLKSNERGKGQYAGKLGIDVKKADIRYPAQKKRYEDYYYQKKDAFNVQRPNPPKKEEKYELPEGTALLGFSDKTIPIISPIADVKSFVDNQITGSYTVQEISAGGETKIEIHSPSGAGKFTITKDGIEIKNPGVGLARAALEYLRGCSEEPIIVHVANQEEKAIWVRAFTAIRNKHSSRQTLMVAVGDDKPKAVTSQEYLSEEKEDIYQSRILANPPGVNMDCMFYTASHVFAQAVRKGSLDYLVESDKYKEPLTAFLKAFSEQHSEFKAAVDAMDWKEQFQQFKYWLAEYSSANDTEVLLAPVLRKISGTQKGSMVTNTTMVNFLNDLGIRVKCREEGNKAVVDQFRDTRKSGFKNEPGQPIFYIENIGIHWVSWFKKEDEAYANQVSAGGRRDQSLDKIPYGPYKNTSDYNKYYDKGADAPVVKAPKITQALIDEAKKAKEPVKLTLLDRMTIKDKNLAQTIRLHRKAYNELKAKGGKLSDNDEELLNYHKWAYTKYAGLRAEHRERLGQLITADKEVAKLQSQFRKVSKKRAVYIRRQRELERKQALTPEETKELADAKKEIGNYTKTRQDLRDAYNKAYDDLSDIQKERLAELDDEGLAKKIDKKSVVNDLLKGSDDVAVLEVEKEKNEKNEKNEKKSDKKVTSVLTADPGKGADGKKKPVQERGENYLAKLDDIRGAIGDKWDVPDYKGGGKVTITKKDNRHEQFDVKPNKFETRSKLDSSFVDMLKAFKAADPSSIPKITTYSESVARQWLRAFDEVYKGADFRPQITVDSSYASAPAAKKAADSGKANAVEVPPPEQEAKETSTHKFGGKVK